MTDQAIALAISIACGFNSPGTTDKKIECKDFMINCAIEFNKEVDEELLRNCAKRAKNGETYEILRGQKRRQ